MGINIKRNESVLCKTIKKFHLGKSRANAAEYKYVQLYEPYTKLIESYEE
jgi:hypothetical protein